MKVELHHDTLRREAVEMGAAADPPQEQNWVQVSLVRYTEGPLRTPIKQRFDDLLKFLARYSQMIFSCATFTAGLSFNDAYPLQVLESFPRAMSVKFRGGHARGH
jgi:hypothetical protein